MWGSISRSIKSHLLRCAFFFGIIFILSGGILGGDSIANVAVAHAITGERSRIATNTCSSAADPTNQSLLVVLLDRSGSLIYEPGATDPNGYSTSVTNVLADLWPGSMAVVPFSNNKTPILGPATLSDPTARADLKHSINSYPIGGNTPLGPAMHQALNLLRGAAPGSRVIVVTDGNPTGDGNNDGAHQEKDIRSNLIPQFCNQAIPVSAFGLTIDPNTANGQDANRLLTDITNGTNASYQPVRRPEELARAVIQLYAQWLHLSFIEANVQNGNAPVSIDSSAKQVTILTFRSGSTTGVTLDGPDGQPIQGVQPLEDRHYIIDSLASGSGVFVAGTYTIHTSNDSDVQVYELVNSTLQIQITAPIEQEKLFYNKPIEIEAKFVDSGNDKQPKPGEAEVVAKVKFLVNGKQVSSALYPLIQNGVTFKGQIPVYGKSGELQIEVDGTDQGVQRSSSTYVQLVTPPKPPPPPCKLGFVGCLLQQVQQFWTQHSTLIVISCLVLLLLLLLLLWITRPSPFGGLKQTPKSTPIPLGQGRTFGRRLFKKSVISSDELLDDFSDFAKADFDLAFQRGRVAYIKSKSQTPIRLKNGRTYEEVKSDNKDGAPLSEGSVINIAGRDAAIFTEAD